MNKWVRRGWFYEYRKSIEVPISRPDWVWIRTRRLGFISYHMIKWVHGEEKLVEMGQKD